MILSLRNKLLHFFDKHFSSSLISSREILELIFPIIVDQAFFIGMAIINTAMISASGMAAISAVNMVESLNVFLINLFIAVATGGTVLIAQYRGMHNREMIRKATMGNITAVFLLATSIAIIVIIFHNPILSFLFGKADEEVMSYAKIYLIGIMLSYPLSGIINASCCSLRGVGETSSSLFISLITNVSYVLLNVLFINILKMSVLGMVIALFIGRSLGATYAILYLNFKNESLHFSIRRLYPIDFTMIKKIITIGIPFASEQAFFNGGKILTQVFIVGMGTVAITTNAISNSITLLLEIIPGSLNLALVTIVGLCVGSKQIDIAKRYIKNFIWLASGVTVITSALLFLFFPTLIGLYSTPTTIIPGVLKITIMVAIARIFLFPPSFMIPSGLRAAGDAKFTSIVSMISMWTVRVILGYLLGITFNMGVTGIWLAMILEWGVRGIIFTFRFKGTKWYQHNITD